MLTPEQSKAMGDPEPSWRYGIPSLAASTRRWLVASERAQSCVAETDEAFAARRQAAADRGLL
jgi:hypothetical protein